MPAPEDPTAPPVAAASAPAAGLATRDAPALSSRGAISIGPPPRPHAVTCSSALSRYQPASSSHEPKVCNEAACADGVPTTFTATTAAPTANAPPTPSATPRRVLEPLLLMASSSCLPPRAVGGGRGWDAAQGPPVPLRGS